MSLPNTTRPPSPRQIPRFVASLSELRVLDVSANRVEYLDASLLRLRQLQVVAVHSNPQLPADVAEAAAAGVGQLWLYLQAWQGNAGRAAGWNRGTVRHMS